MLTEETRKKAVEAAAKVNRRRRLNRLAEELRSAGFKVINPEDVQGHAESEFRQQAA